MWKLGDVLQQESFEIYTKHSAGLFVQKKRVVNKETCKGVK
jgi:hypothetical protein